MTPKSLHFLIVWWSVVQSEGPAINGRSRCQRGAKYATVQQHCSSSGIRQQKSATSTSAKPDRTSHIAQPTHFRSHSNNASWNAQGCTQMMEFDTEWWNHDTTNDGICKDWHYWTESGESAYPSPACVFSRQSNPPQSDLIQSGPVQSSQAKWIMFLLRTTLPK